MFLLNDLLSSLLNTDTLNDDTIEQANHHQYRYIGEKPDVEVYCCNVCGLAWGKRTDSSRDTYMYANDTCSGSLTFKYADSIDIMVCPNKPKGVFFKGKLK